VLQNTWLSKTDPLGTVGAINHYINPKSGGSVALGPISAKCAFKMNMFKDLFAGVRNVIGGRTGAVQQTMRDSRRTALYELKRKAFEVGAK
jgi:hypothetical protein